MWPNYGLELNDRYAVFLSQHNSIFLGGIGIISLLFRDVVDGDISRKILTGLMWTNILGVIITLYAPHRDLHRIRLVRPDLLRPAGRLELRSDPQDPLIPTHKNPRKELP